MSNHLTEKEIDYIVSGMASEKDLKKYGEHVRSCPRCRMMIETLSLVIAEDPVDTVPGSHVRDRVVCEWHRLHSENTEKVYQSKSRVRFFAAGFAAAAAVVVAVSSYIFLSVPSGSDAYLVAVTSVSGEVMLDNSAAAVNETLSSGSVLRTGENSGAVLGSENYALYIGRLTSLSLLRNSRESGISFRLNEGSVISKSSGLMRYSFQCGDYLAAPAGTEFMLNFHKGKLDISVLNGSVVVNANGTDTEVSSMRKWSSDNPGITQALDNQTAGIISSGDLNDNADNSLYSESAAGKSDKNKSEEKTENKNKVIKTVDRKNIKNENKEKPEKIKLDRELRDDMKEMKKEQRKEKKERKGKNRD